MMILLCLVILCLNVRVYTYRKNHYKNKLTSLTKEFKNFKNEHSSLTILHDKIVNDLKNSNSLEEQLKKVNDENHKLSNEMLKLKNSISKF